MHLDDWAQRWGISPAAIQDLRKSMGIEEKYVSGEGMAETPIQQRVRLAAAKKGIRLWRNNRGAFKDKSGRWVRFGLMNDTPELNKIIKSHDLIGITPRIITPADIGKTLGIFTTHEIKKFDWRYTGKGREVQQLAWANLILSLGGIAKFINNPKDV